MMIFLTARRKVRGKGSVPVTSEFGWSGGSWCHVDSGESAVYVPWLRLAVKGRAQMLVALRCDSCVTSLTRVFLFPTGHTGYGVWVQNCTGCCIYLCTWARKQGYGAVARWRLPFLPGMSGERKLHEGRLAPMNPSYVYGA